MNMQRSEIEQVSFKQASGSVLKALDIIDVLAQAGRPLPLSELVRQLGRPMASVHRLLRTLELRNYVEKVEGQYRLTLKLLEIGSAALPENDGCSGGTAAESSSSQGERVRTLPLRADPCGSFLAPSC